MKEKRERLGKLLILQGVLHWALNGSDVCVLLASMDMATPIISPSLSKVLGVTRQKLALEFNLDGRLLRKSEVKGSDVQRSICSRLRGTWRPISGLSRLVMLSYVCAWSSLLIYLYW